MSVDDRLSQIVIEVGSEGEASSRLSQIVTEIGSEGEASSRLSQIVIEIASAEGLAGQRISQIVVEVASEGGGGTNEHNNPPSGTQENLAQVREEPIIFVAVQSPDDDRKW